MSAPTARGLEQEFAVVVSCLMAGRMSGPQAVASLTAIASPALDAIVAERVAALAEDEALVERVTRALVDASGAISVPPSGLDRRMAVAALRALAAALTERRSSDG